VPGTGFLGKLVESLLIKSPLAVYRDSRKAGRPTSVSIYHALGQRRAHAPWPEIPDDSLKIASAALSTLPDPEIFLELITTVEATLDASLVAEKDRIFEWVFERGGLREDEA
jgi:hypothetical protein